MYPNRQFLSHLVVPMPFCLHVLFRVVGGNWGGRGNRQLGYVPLGVPGYRCAQAITMQRGGGVPMLYGHSG